MEKTGDKDWRKEGRQPAQKKKKKKKSRKDNKGDGVSWQCPLRKGPPSALVQLYSTTHACFPYLTHFSDSVQIKLHSSSVCHEGMGPFTRSCCSINLFKIYLFIYLLVSLTSLSWLMSRVNPNPNPNPNTPGQNRSLELAENQRKQSTQSNCWFVFG